MRRWVLICLAVPAVAGAKSPDWYADGAGSVEVPADGASLPLLRGPETHAFPAVVATVPDADGEPTEQLVYITFADHNHVPPDVLAELGIAPKGDGSVVISELRLGDVVLHDVHAGSGQDQPFLLNAATLEEAAVALLPSQGVVQVAPASGADALLSAVGQPVEYRIAEDPYWFHGQKLTPSKVDVEVPGSFGDTEGWWHVACARDPSSLGGEVALPEGTQFRGGTGYAVVTAQVAGAQAPPAWFSQDQGLVSPEGDLLGTLGYDVLYVFDIAIDPSTRRIAIADASDVKAEDPGPWAAAKAQTAYEKAGEEQADEESAKESGEETTGDPAAVTRETALADALWESAGNDEALTHFKAAAAAAGDDCKPYMAYGKALIRSDRAADAAAPLERAATLWDQWDSQPLDLRQKIEKGKNVGEDAFTVVQDASCYEAWGQLAAARLAQGDHDGVAELYEAHFALDPYLAEVYGVSLLSRGDTEGANGVFRQALDAGARHESWARLGLGLANVHNGRDRVVDAQIDVLTRLPAPLGLVEHFIAFGMVNTARGPEAALAAAQALADADPLSASARLSLVLAARQLGGDVDTDAELEAARELLASRAKQSPHDGVSEPLEALAMALAGDLEGARAKLDTVDRITPDSTFVQALVVAMEGDLEGSSAKLATLARRYPALPLPLNWPAPGVTEVP